MHVRRNFDQYAKTRWETTTQVIKSIHLIHFFPLTNYVWPTGSSILQENLHFESAKSIPNIAALSFRRLRKTCNLLEVYRIFQVTHVPLWLNMNVIILKWWLSHLLTYPNGRVKKKSWNGKTMTITTSHGELCLKWLMDVNTDWASAVCRQRLNKWSGHPQHITKAEAVAR